MATFSISIRSTKRYNYNRKFEVESAQQITIGRSAACGITVRDSLMSDLHATIRFRDGHFEIQDAGTSTGTWVASKPARNPVRLASDDEIGIGSTLIKVGDLDEAAAKIVLAANVNTFGMEEFTKEEDETEYAPGDIEKSFRLEIGFGRNRLLWTAVWSFVFIGLAIGVSLAWPESRKALLEPGRLHDRHRALFDGSAPSALLRAHAQSIEKGCAACHEGTAGATNASCQACHPETLSQHPFRDQPAGPWHDEICAGCHVDHLNTARGERRSASLWPDQGVRVSFADGLFVPTADDAEETCRECHEDEDFTLDRARGLLKKRTNTSYPHLKPESLTRLEYIFYDGFDHGRHAEAGTQCTDCHRPRTGDGASVRDFEVVDFKHCLSCHHHPSSAEHLRPEKQDPKWSPKMRFALSWHGASAPPNEEASRCLGCHAEMHDKALATLPHSRPGFAGSEVSSFRYRRDPRPHANEMIDRSVVFEPPETPALRLSCSDCHRNETILSQKEERVDPFRHGSHSRRLFSRDSNADHALLRTASDDCLKCHVEIVASETLGTPHFGGATGDCRECHDTGDGHPEMVKTDPDPARMTQRPNFPHAMHVTSSSEVLAGGCYACHDFNAHDDPKTATPVTPEDVKDCSRCHGDSNGDDIHGFMGGGSCTGCHDRKDPVYAGPLPDRFPQRADDERFPVRERTSFSHFGGGHVGLMTESCIHCHRNAETAKTVSAIENPVESDDRCRECHVVRKRRFHWR